MKILQGYNCAAIRHHTGRSNVAMGREALLILLLEITILYIGYKDGQIKQQTYNVTMG